MTRKPAGAPPGGTSLAGPGRPDAAPEPGSTGASDGGPGAGGRAASRAPARGGRAPWRAVFFALAALAIVAGVAWALLDSRFFVVRRIEVTGTHLVTPAAVRAAAGIPMGVPLVRVDGATAARRVEQIRQVAAARVSTGWPDQVTITVTERVPALAVPSGHSFHLIDPDGVIVQTVPARPAGLPVLRTPAGAVAATLRGSPAVHAASVIMRELPRALARALAYVQAPAASGVTLTLRSGVTIVWGGTGRAAAKAQEVTLLMRTGARHIDVSAPGTAVTSG
jgi:cell division protein FtsQ